MFNHKPCEIQRSVPMNKKYYISKQIYFSGLEINEIWTFLTEFFINYGKKLTIVKEIDKREIELNPQLLNHSEIENEEASKIYISQKPFQKNESQMYLCYEYEVTGNIISVFSEDILHELLETHLTKPFVIHSSNNKIFWMNYIEVGALLYPKEVEIFNNFGIDFQEWNIKLNETL